MLARGGLFVGNASLGVRPVAACGSTVVRGTPTLAEATPTTLAADDEKDAELTCSRTSEPLDQRQSLVAGGTGSAYRQHHTPPGYNTTHDNSPPDGYSYNIRNPVYFV